MAWLGGVTFVGYKARRADCIAFLLLWLRNGLARLRLTESESLYSSTIRIHIYMVLLCLPANIGMSMPYKSFVEYDESLQNSVIGRPHLIIHVFVINHYSD